MKTFHAPQKFITSTYLKKVKVSLRAHLAWLSDNERYNSSFFMYLILFWSYSQICLMDIRFARKYINDEDSTPSQILKTIENIMTFDNLFEYTRPGGGLIPTLIIFLIYFIIAFGCLIALIHGICKCTKPSRLALEIWSFIFQFNIPIMYFLIGGICSRIQSEYMHSILKVFESDANNTALLFFSIGLSSVNFLFSALMVWLLSNVLPTKNTLSAPNPYIDHLTYAQKVLDQFFWHLLPQNIGYFWFIIVLNLFFSLLKLCFYYTTFPRYHFKALKFNAYMLTAEVSMIILIPTIYLLNQIEGVNISITSLFLISIIVIILAILVTRGILITAIHRIIEDPYDRITSCKVIHKIMILKYFKKTMNPPSEYKSYIDIRYFYFRLICSQKNKVFEASKHPFKVCCSAKEELKWSIRQFLEQVTRYYPKNNLLKLYLAKFYAKSLNLFPNALIVLGKLNSISPSITISCDIIRLQMQELMLKDNQSAHYELNLSEFIVTQNQIQDIKQQITDQINLHRLYWKEYDKDKPDLFRLQILSEKIDKKQKTIRSMWNRRKINSEFRQPLLLYGYYAFVMNNSFEEGHRYMDMYALLTQKQKKFKTTERLGQSSIYSNKNVMVTIKADMENIGAIVKCSPNIEQILGFTPKFVLGLDVGVLITPYIGEKHSTFVQKYLRSGETRFINKINEVFVKNKQNFLIKASLFVKLHPILQHELYFTGLIRPLKTFEDYMLITPKGLIDCTSEDIAKKLGIIDQRINIRSICRGFGIINNAFNFVALKNSSMSIGAEESDQTPTRRQKQSPTYTPASVYLESSFDMLHYTGRTAMHIQDESENRKLRKESKDYSEFDLEKIYERWNCEGGELEFESYSGSSDAIMDSWICTCKIELMMLASGFMKVLKIMKIVKGRKATYKETIRRTIIIKKEDTSFYSRRVLDTPNEFSFNGSDNSSRVNQDETKRTREGLKKHSFDGGYQKIGSNSFIEISKEESPTNLSISQTKSSILVKKRRVYAKISEALQTNFYPKKRFLLIFIFMAFMAGSFSGYLYLYNLRNQNFDFLHSLATTLDLANIRLDSLLSINRGARINQMLLFGLIDDSITSDVAGIVNLFLSNIPEWMTVLRDSNNRLQVAIRDINQEFQDRFTRPNIRMYDINPDLSLGKYQKFNTFAANTILIEKISTYLQTGLRTGNFPVVELMYILKNSLNDLLIESVDATEIILADIKAFSQDEQISSLIFVGAIFILEVFGLLVIFYVIYRFYNLEVNQIGIYLRIPSNQIDYIQNMLQKFEEGLRTDHYDDHLCPNLHDFREKEAKGSQFVTKFKKSKTEGLQRRYWFKLLLLSLVVMGYLFYMGSIYNKGSYQKNNLVDLIERLVLVESLQTNFQLSIIGYSTMVVDNGTSTIKNRPSLDELGTNLNQLFKDTNGLLEAFTDQDGNFDPEMEPIFFGDACAFVTSQNIAACLTAVKESKTMSLISMVNQVHSLVNLQREDYINSNKTFKELQTIVGHGLLYLDPPAVTLRDLLLLVTDKVRVNLVQKHDLLQKFYGVLGSINYVVFGIACVAAWLLALHYFISYSIRFRKMMKIVPIDIIIGDRILKSMLIKSCNGMLDSIKNEL